MAGHDAEAVARALAAKLGGKVRKSGRHWRCRCPAHDDRNESLDLTEGDDGRILWKCRAGCSQEAVLRALQHVGLYPGPNGDASPTGRTKAPGNGRMTATAGRPKPNGRAKPAEAPAAVSNGSAAGIPEPPVMHPTLGEPTFRHEYHDADGRLIFYHCRFDRPDGSKEFRPLSFRGSSWEWKDLHGPLPIYGLTELAARPGDPVLVVEGEKKADIARELLPNDVVIGWPHGAGAIEKVDWAPLAGRDVVLWPDNNPPGLKAVRVAAEAILAAGARSVRTVELPPDLPMGWDLGDEPPPGWDLDRINHLIGIAVDTRDLKLRDLGILTDFDLEARNFLPPRFVVPDLIPEGLTFLAGKPKAKKSWLMLGVADAVARAGRALGAIDCERAGVLYLALEDPHGRLKARMRCVRQGEAATGRVFFVNRWKRLDQGGLDDLRLFLERHPDVRLVVLDTFAKIRARPNTRAQLYDEDYAAGAQLKALADEFRVAVVCVHHVRKQVAEDFIDDVSGSTGLTAAADAILVLRGERGRADAVLHVTGRDIAAERELALRWDEETAHWSVIGDAEEVRRSQERNAVLRVLRDAETPMTPTQLAKTLDKKVENVKVLLSRMRKAGEVGADAKGRYSVL